MRLGNYVIYSLYIYNFLITIIPFFFLAYLQFLGVHTLHKHLELLGWQLRDCGFCQYHLMTKYMYIHTIHISIPTEQTVKIRCIPILRFVKNLINITTIIESHDSVNKIRKYESNKVQNIFTKDVYTWSYVSVSLRISHTMLRITNIRYDLQIQQISRIYQINQQIIVIEGSMETPRSFSNGTLGTFWFS